MLSAEVAKLNAPSKLPTIWTRDNSDRHPLVSICIPSFNHNEYVEASVRSALAQTYDRIEVLVSDDCSDDGSYDRLLAVNDSRLQVERNPRRLGHAANRNRVVARARGALIKFLDDDDLLDPECVADMVDAFTKNPEIGMAFSRRRIAVEGSVDTERQAWLDRYSHLQRDLVGLHQINDGRNLFELLLERNFHMNLIGEPSTVMVSKTHLQRIGAFSLHVHQLMDLDLWSRLLPHCWAAFIDRECVVYRIGHESSTRRNISSRQMWLDRLWLLENLSQDREVTSSYPKITELLRVERRHAWRTFVNLGSRAHHSVPVSLYLPYARHRVRRLARIVQ